MTMQDLIANFPRQLDRAIEIAEATRIPAAQREIRNVLVTGLGGSGIGGTIVGEWLKDQLTIPLLVSKDYNIPGFVNENSLVICCSYSGNTEETLSSLEQAISAGADIVCITSGGKLQEIAQKNGLGLIVIDGGMPPRSCLGYAVVSLLRALEAKGLIDEGYKNDITLAATLLRAEKEEIINEARRAAEKLNGKIPVIYADASNEGVAVRFRQQIDENSKMLCWHHVIPEMNHNELVGWRDEHPEVSVVFLRNQTDNPRNQQRMEFTKDVVKKYAADVSELWSKGSSRIQRALYLIHLTDWISVYLSELNGHDATEIDVINKLKDTLAKS